MRDHRLRQCGEARFQTQQVGEHRAARRDQHHARGDGGVDIRAAQRVPEHGIAFGEFKIVAGTGQISVQLD
jgi:hypothetical protein